MQKTEGARLLRCHSAHALEAAKGTMQRGAVSQRGEAEGGASGRLTQMARGRLTQTVAGEGRKWPPLELKLIPTVFHPPPPPASDASTPSKPSLQFPWAL